MFGFTKWSIEYELPHLHPRPLHFPHRRRCKERLHPSTQIMNALAVGSPKNKEPLICSLSAYEIGVYLGYLIKC